MLCVYHLCHCGRHVTNPTPDPEPRKLPLMDKMPESTTNQGPEPATMKEPVKRTKPTIAQEPEPVESLTRCVSQLHRPCPCGYSWGWKKAPPTLPPFRVSCSWLSIWKQMVLFRFSAPHYSTLAPCWLLSPSAPPGTIALMASPGSLVPSATSLCLHHELSGL